MKMISAPFQRNSCAFYFGKIKSRGDFVKSTAGAQVIARIDRWIAQGMEDFIAAPHWKTAYDRGEPIDFLFMGTQRKHAIHGTMVPGCDASARRFPFVAGTVFEVSEPHDLLTIGPICFDRHTAIRRQKAAAAVTSESAFDALAWLAEPHYGSCLTYSAAAERFRHFLASTTVAELTAMLALCGQETTIRQIVLALHCLLQPLRETQVASLAPPEKAIALPLPEDPSHRANVESFWLSLINVFLHTTNLELCVLSGVMQGRHKLVITFNGATPLTFRALFDEQAAQALLIDLQNAAWADQETVSDNTAMILSSYLNHDSLLLQQIVMTFQETGRL